MRAPIDWTTDGGECRECGGPGQLWLVPDGDDGVSFIAADLCEEHAAADDLMPWEPALAVLLEEVLEALAEAGEHTEEVG